MNRGAAVSIGIGIGIGKGIGKGKGKGKGETVCMMYVSLSKLPYRVGAVCGTGCVMHRVFDLGNATQRCGI